MDGRFGASSGCRPTARRDVDAGQLFAYEKHLVCPGGKWFEAVGARRVVEVNMSDLKEPLQSLHQAVFLLLRPIPLSAHPGKLHHQLDRSVRRPHQVRTAVSPTLRLRRPSSAQSASIVAILRKLVSYRVEDALALFLEVSRPLRAGDEQ